MIRNAYNHNLKLFLYPRHLFNNNLQWMTGACTIFSNFNSLNGHTAKFYDAHSIFVYYVNIPQ